MKALIIAHGGIENIDILKKLYPSYDIVICADGGAKYAYACDIIPDYLIGDFDSIDNKILDFYTLRNVSIEKYPKNKDYTDTELCIYKAIDLGCSELCIFAGIGSRIDHSLGNIGLLHIIKSYGAQGYIITENETIYLCNDMLSLKGKEGDIISIIPFFGDAEGVTTEGLLYSLNNDTIKFGYPIGVSNVMVNNECIIKIVSGEILVIKQNNENNIL
ncbi:thiamine diphosphokinase [Caloramator quimbayensis]|uniref:Thiamine diphosphokinase n=1 Tax=Caloramator quimbayensis TaxID=1147123 RepID=A0A1T4XRZ9_9CLOT|nr:thiamine diphosphokinase [Caloramator quimbayensis]SKA92356.1 thiamine diphosphokinase [Caloramator quimbayensis]